MIGTIADPIAAFYTRHPYPPPVENLDRARDEWRDATRHRVEHHLLWPDEPYRAELDILVAGCGTWQAARYAVTRPAARVVGIDVSATSIDCTDALRRRYDLSNLELRLLPIEQVATLERRFDLIVCTGVLHHLADPDAGLRALRSVLKPGGVIDLMVYARHGRTGIAILQDYCRVLGIGTSPAELDDLMAVVEQLPPHHPAVAVLRHARDSRDVRALADALLNPRDQSYTVPELFDFVERSELTVGRWRLQAPYLPQCGAFASTPHAARVRALSARGQYTALELWRGTMTHHSALVYENGAAPAMADFTGERWRDYVPLRLPGTLTVRERLPEGAAAVLLNRGHQHHDLIVAITEEGRRMFAAIDGRRTVAEIAGGRAGLSRARAFFEQLWCADQVVFATGVESRTPSTS